MRYIECCRGEAAIALNMDTGSRVAIARSAMGRAYLARLRRGRAARHHGGPPLGRRRSLAAPSARASTGRWRIIATLGLRPLLRRMAADGERHRGRLPPRRRPAADVDQLRRAHVILDPIS
jgi:hypothetical protein